MKHPTHVEKDEDKKQLSLLGFKNCPPVQSNNITMPIAEFVARDMCPISTVDSSGFQQLLHYMEPGYKLPSCPFLTNTCHKLYSSLKEKLLEVMASPELYVAITSNLWTSRAVESYLTITVHFINSEWKLESKVLQTKEMSKRHTGENIAEVLSSAINRWKIDERRISAVVHDNASNMNLAIEKLWCGDVPCFAHTLQLAVHNGLEIGQINKLSSVSRKLVGHFKHSSLATTALKDKQQQLSISQHHLVQDMATRLNSTYFMYETLL